MLLVRCCCCCCRRRCRCCCCCRRRNCLFGVIVFVLRCVCMCVCLSVSMQAAMRGQAEFRVERQGIIMAGLGKLSFTDAQLKDNLRAFMIALSNAKPEQVKGQYFRVRAVQPQWVAVVAGARV